MDQAIRRGMGKGWIQPDKDFLVWWSESGSMEKESSAGSDNGWQWQGEWWKASSYQAENRTDKKASVGKELVPEHDGITMREYERRVRLFEQTTAIDPEFRAGRLLEKLKGDAWAAAETIDLKELKAPNGVAKLLKHLWSELEPLEYLRTFQTLSYFYKQFKRQKGQEFVAFDTAFRTQCKRLEECQSPLEGTAKAFWYLEKASISEELRRQVVASAGGVYEYTRLREALVAIVPQIRRQDLGEEPARKEYPAREGRSRFFKRAHGVHAVIDGGEGQGGDEDDSWDLDGLESEELDELEAEVMLTHAARRRSAAEKERGFGKPESAETREKRIAEMKKRMPEMEIPRKTVTLLRPWCWRLQPSFARWLGVWRCQTRAVRERWQALNG